MAQKRLSIRALHQFLTSNGSGGGTNQAIGDYSTSNERAFYVQPASRETFEIDHMRILIGDTGTFVNLVSNYGAIAGGLAEGIIVRSISRTNGAGSNATNDEIRWTGTNGTVQVTADWAQFASLTVSTNAGTNQVLVQADWYFNPPVTLDGKVGEQFQAFFQDSLTGLTRHSFFVNGSRKGFGGSIIASTASGPADTNTKVSYTPPPA